MINIIDGGIMIHNILVNAEMRRQVFIQSDLIKYVTKEFDQSYVQYYLQPQRIGNNYFNVNITFTPEGRIMMISMSIYDGKPPSWEDWSEEKEQKKKIVHDQLLQQALGEPPYNYEWGNISSAFSPQSGSSSIDNRDKKDTLTAYIQYHAGNCFP